MVLPGYLGIQGGSYEVFGLLHYWEVPTCSDDTGVLREHVVIAISQNALTFHFRSSGKTLYELSFHFMFRAALHLIPHYWVNISEPQTRNLKPQIIVSSLFFMCFSILGGNIPKS